MTGTTTESLYETDYYAWTRREAAALRKLAERRSDLPVDAATLADEVADLGTARRDAVRSQVRRVLEHLLKLEFSPAAGPRVGCQRTVSEVRFELADKMTATLRRDAGRRLPGLYAQARHLARLALREHGEDAASDALPEDCPYALDEVCRHDWYPASRHGFTDGSAGT